VKLELKGINKSFGSVVANSNIDLEVNPGEIIGLLGENGAGKSTLMNVLYGLYTPDSGEILLDGARTVFKGPGDAMASGIGMVHQHFMLIPVFSVAENVILGNEPTNLGGTLDLDQARFRVKDLSERFGFNIDPDTLVQDLPVGAQQRVEIIKALSRQAKVLVLDEPTAVLTPQETDELMEIMRQLSKEGTSIIFITHKLREVRAVANRIVVMRQGTIAGSALPTASNSELASLMVGREVELTVEKSLAKAGEALLEVKNLSVLDDRGYLAVDGVDFSVHRGEIFALAGVQGNGQTELAEAILGLRPKTKNSGYVKFKGKNLKDDSVRDALESGIGFIPEDRKKDGLVKEFSIAENLMLNQSFSSVFTKGPSIDFDSRQKISDSLIKRFDVRTPSSETMVANLSGGNQQKVVIARELNREIELLIASQPTRGVDVGSIEFIHEQIVSEREKGKGVLLVSSELDEVISLADRIAVMYRGKIVGVVDSKTPRETIGKMMAGVVE
jgi:general nucleoside transport system ATP-binding protein